MRYWFDTEFIEDGKTIDLLSIGMVAEDGRELYLQADWTDWEKASPWVKENVLPYLERRRDAPSWRTRAEMRFDIYHFCHPETFGKPEFWAYYADYDWVVFCQIFGLMIDLPEGWPKYCLDIKQLCKMLGDPKLPKQSTGEHHALADARHNKVMYDFLLELQNA